MFTKPKIVLRLPRRKAAGQANNSSLVSAGRLSFVGSSPNHSSNERMREAEHAQKNVVVLLTKQSIELSDEQLQGQGGVQSVTGLNIGGATGDQLHNFVNTPTSLRR